MVFVSPIFLFLFLPATLILYGLACLTRSRALKNGALLGCSLAFYAWGGVKYALLLMGSTVVNYLFGRLLAREKGRKAVLTLAVIYNTGILFFFKYLNFFADTAQAAAEALHMNWSIEIPAITLPIGISFFTFQIMSYIFDVYNRKVEVQKNLLDLALYIMLFPQLIAGPIVRYIDVNREIRERHTDMDMVHEGIIRFMTGFCKKIFLANSMGYAADMIFGRVYELNTPYAWLGAVCYALQIYMDFSSYSDMAIGLGKLFGFHFLENFQYPYSSRSIREFWRRWHISLSSWFRDYVYIPLGGSRKGAGKTYRNLLVVFLLTGLWHGANWTFLAWGMFHGIFLVLERGAFGRLLERFPGWLKRLYTLAVVLIGWVFFRCSTITEAFAYLKAMFAFDFGHYNVYQILECFDREFLLMAVISLIGCLPLAPAWNARFRQKQAVGLITDLGLFAVFACAVLYMVGADFNPFIYFRF